MAKPTKLPVWATDLSNVTEPTSGQKDTGWTNNQPAVSSYFNWLFYTIYLWLAYIDAGVWDDDLTVTGNLTVNGDTDLDGALNVGGASSFGDDINVTAGKTINFADDGKVNHANRSVSVHPVGHFSGPGTGSPGTGGLFDHTLTYTLSVTGGKLHVPVHGLRPGDRITKVYVMWTSAAGAPSVRLSLELASTTAAYSTNTIETNVFDGINVTEYEVDTPTRLSYYANSLSLGMTDYLAQRASIEMVAGSDNTVIYGIQVIYDSADAVYTSW